MPVKKEKDSEDNHRISRSNRLRKYASVYKSYVRKTEQSKISKSPRVPRIISRKTTEKPSRKKEETHSNEVIEKHTKNKKSKVVQKSRKPLNSYQKFVQQESKKDIYKDMPGKQRLSAIAVEWKNGRK